jgi:protoporphyrin/coproporphyrin ferrochelatase
MAYGTPKSLDDVEVYFTHMRGGQKPSRPELENLIHRYKAIGGTSPLIAITERLRDKLQERLRQRGSGTRVYTAMKHSPPFIADVVRKAAEDGIDELLAVALAPHYSKMSIGTYMMAVEEANSALQRKMKLDVVLSWHTNPKLIHAWTDSIKHSERSLPRDYFLVFSAHSLPEKILASGDPYRSELVETSELIAKQVGKADWGFAFQSASHSKEPWLGPDILSYLQDMLGNGKTSFLIAPIGFVSDHLEILYDIDVECKEWASANGAQLARCDSLNDSPGMIECLDSIITENHYLQ